MNEQLNKSPEQLFPSARDYSRKLMQVLEEHADHPEAFAIWKTALGDIVRLLHLERKKNAAEEKAEETQLDKDKAEAVKQSSLWAWKAGDNERKGDDPMYKIAYMHMRLTAFQIETAYEQEGHDHPFDAAIQDLEKLREYSKRL